MADELEKELKVENPDKYYSWGEEIGRGEFAVIKACAVKGKGLPYAGKFIKYEDDNDKMMAVREFGILKGLDHHNINKFYEGYIVRKYIVLILELLEGRDILGYLAAKLAVTEDTLFQLTKQVMEALVHIHGNKVAHLDIRPDNLMITKSGELKIIDFGCARRIETKDGGAIGEVAGNSEFRAPELFNFEPVDISADMWSYGIIMYGIISGKLPFPGDTDEEILEKMHKRPDLSDAVWKRHSDSVKALISNLIVKNPSKRLSAKQVLEHEWLASSELKRRKAIAIDNKRVRDFKQILDELDDEPISASCVLRTFDEEEFISPESSEEEESD